MKKPIPQDIWDLWEYSFLQTLIKRKSKRLIKQIAESGSLFIPVNSLIVKDENDCVKLLDHSWSSIIIGDELCNSMTSSLNISAYMNLTYLEIGSKSLTNISSLIIENNPLLTSFITIESDSCSNVEELVIQSSCIFLLFNRFTSIISF